MKFLFAVLIFCSFAHGQMLQAITNDVRHSSGTWTFTQLKYQDSLAGGTGGGACTTGTTSCVVNISAPVAGHVLIAFSLAAISNVSATMTTPTGGQTWTHCPSCLSADTANGAVDAWYVVSATATGQTTVTCNFSSVQWNDNGYSSCGFVEAAWSGTSISFDTSNTIIDSTNCTSCASGSLTLGGTDYVFRAAITLPGSGVTNISDAAFTNPKQFYSGTGQAGKLNATGTDNPTWTQGSSTLAAFGIAFKGN